MKTLIKMNLNDNQLSYGNLNKILKSLAKNKKILTQSDIFYILFEVDNISDTTINNYIVGIRSIHSDYKEIYLKKLHLYKSDPDVLLPVISSLIAILESSFDLKVTKEYIKNSNTIKILCNKLFNLAKNDDSTTDKFKEKLSFYINSKNYISFLSEILFFVIIEKKQPAYVEDTKLEVIQNILSNTMISINDVEKYLKLKLVEGSNYNYALKTMSNNNNSYALYELGMNEYKGYVTGKRRYEVAFDYFLKASNNNHPGANHMVASLIIKNQIENNSSYNLDFAYKKLEYAINLGSVAAINLKGIMFYNGIYPAKKNINEALKLFEKAASYNYAYAFNNLGMHFENKKDNKKAFEYYLKSANLNECWASNKVGMYYFEQRDYKNCFKYLNNALEDEFYSLYSYTLYNLATIFYEKGFPILNIKQDYNKAFELFNIAAKKNNIDAQYKLLLHYYKEFKINNDDYTKLKVLEIKKNIETNPTFNIEFKNKIETVISKLDSNLNININLDV